MATKKKAGKGNPKAKGSSKGRQGKGQAKSKTMSTKRKIGVRGGTAVVGTPITTGGDD